MGEYKRSRDLKYNQLNEKFVLKALARTLLTATQKKKMEMTIKIIGSCNHPTERKIVRNTISIGIVIINRVIITSRRLG